jgi:hypothetical protein
MHGMLPAKPAILFQVEFIGGVSLVFIRRIIFSLTVAAGEENYFPHFL